MKKNDRLKEVGFVAYVICCELYESKLTVCKSK